MLKTSGAALGGAVAAGCASVAAEGEARMPFKVAQVTVPIAGSSEVFPVRRIYCIGRNYAAHSREMGSDPTREPPFFFQKPTDAIQYVPTGTVGNHAYPSLTKNYHYELELVAFLKSGGTNIRIEEALQHVYGYTVGLDMTRRDLQRAMGDEKKPWEIGKSFDHAAPMGPVIPLGRVQHLTQGAIVLTVNGAVKQKADLSYMMWSVAEQISKLSEANELMAGDIIYSGTPENVGPVVKGDVLLGHIDGLPDLSIKIV
jgi:2-keto-4-pentenoate hydratase/2-oxohepta-3-ene-1,7-dioic acid hydratase in catechol pathway